MYNEMEKMAAFRSELAIYKRANDNQAYHEEVKKKKKQYKEEKKRIDNKYDQLSSGAGVTGAGLYALKRGAEGARTGKKFGFGGGVKTLSAGAIANLGASALSSPFKKKKMEDLEDRYQ